MTSTAINEKLKAVYGEYVDDLYSKTWDKEVSAPLLMRVLDDYVNMDRKIMFVGQETHGWGNMNEKPSVETSQEMYRSFDLGKHADYGDGKKSRYLKSPFWNFNRAFFHRMNGQDSSVSRKTNGFLWTNISKFDYSGTTPSHELQNLNSAGFALLQKEIAICQPDIVIFLTGTKYDDPIRSMFQIDDNKIAEGVPVWKISTLNSGSSKLIFKTEHPRTLSQGVSYRGMKMYHKVLDVLVDQCSQVENGPLND